MIPIAWICPLCGGRKAKFSMRGPAPRCDNLWCFHYMGVMLQAAGQLAFEGSERW